MTPAVSGRAPAIAASGWLLIALRLAAMLISLLACLVFYHVWRLGGIDNPWPRRFLASVARIAGARCTLSGSRTVGGELLLANHVSWLDIPVLAGITGAAFVAHDGLSRFPLLHWLCAMNGTVFVARHDRASVARQVEQVRAAITQTGALAIFPEGTTSDGVALLPFKSSLLSALDPVPAGVAVQPVLLDYGAEAARIAWVGDEPGPANFLRILARWRRLDIAVVFLPPLDPAKLSDRKSIAAAAHLALTQELRQRRSDQRVTL